MSVHYVVDRYATKGLLTLPDQRLVVVAGRRGMWNLPGGGCKPGEAKIDTLYREVHEELGITKSNLRRVRTLPPIQGEVTSRERLMFTEWALYSGRLTIGLDDLQPTKVDEITKITAMLPEEIMTTDNISELAKRAVALHTNVQYA